MTLDARIVRTLGSFRLDVDLTAKSGETVAVLGPNGSGKSTLFRCLAGLLPIDGGRIELDGEPLDDPADDVFVRPEQRPVAVVFQDYLLFPNLSALENVAFGLRARGMAKADARTTRRHLARARRARRPRPPPTARPVRRTSPTRRPGPRPGHRASTAAPRRAARRPRRRHPR